MKELTIEQKARRYDEILTRAEGANLPYYKDDIMSKVKEFVDYLIPELAESEDEKIRRLIKNVILKSVPYPQNVLDGGESITAKDAIAWLEKQCKKGTNGNESEIPFSEHKPLFKEGDTIKCKYDDRQFTIKSVDLDKGTYTYTQEGCGNDIDYADEEFELVEQKPAWNEEDESNLNSAIYFIRREPYHEHDAEPIVDWLRALKDRVQPQPKQEWSEEDESMRTRCIGILGKCYIGELPTKVEEELNWLKSLKPQNTWKPSEEQMIAIQEAMNIVGILTITGSKINSLYQDLKKLKK